MLDTLIRTERDWGALAARLALGVVMFPHGAQKMLGWYGGNGFAATMQFFTESMGIPWILAALAVAAEFFGSLGLILGLLTRVAALGIGSTMLVAILMVHAQYGFFMNWFGNQQGEGFEYHLLAIGLAVALLVRGGGALSLDRLWVSRLRPAGGR